MELGKPHLEQGKSGTYIGVLALFLGNRLRRVVTSVPDE